MATGPTPLSDGARQHRLTTAWSLTNTATSRGSFGAHNVSLIAVRRVPAPCARRRKSRSFPGKFSTASIENRWRSNLALPVSPADIRGWLDRHNLSHLTDVFLTRRWVGDKLLRLETYDLESIEVPSSKCNVLLEEIGALSERRFSASGQALSQSLRLADRLREASWSERVLGEWPAPIAHEVWVLIEQLSEGRVPGALWQLRDVAEVLCKIPGVIMLRDYLEHGIDVDTKSELRRLLIGIRPPSFGHWRTMTVDRLPKLLSEASGSHFVLPELAGLYRDPKGDLTPLALWLNGMVPWRNQVLGHGAFDADDGRSIEKMETQLKLLADALTGASVGQVWADAVLTVSEPQNLILRGWKHLQPDPKCGHKQAVNGKTLPVLVTRGDRLPLALDPYLAVRRCLVCGMQEIFLFNSRKPHKNNCDEFYFLNYATSHSTVSAWWNDPVAMAEARATATVDDYVPTSTGSSSGKMEELLERKALDADYISPAYLRDPLREFLKTHERGIYWLRAPAHIGKTQFVRGLAVGLSGLQYGPKREKPILPNCGVIVFHVRREQQSKPEQLIEALHEQFGHVFDLAREDRYRLRPRIEFEDPERARASFILWLNELFAEVQARSATRLLICLDGIDELPVSGPDRIAMLDLLPASDRLPKGLFLLLTSRLKAECPPLLWSSAARLSSSRYSVHRDVNLKNGDYRSLLVEYFDAGTAALLRGKAAALLEQSVSKGEPVVGTPDPRLAASGRVGNELTAAWESVRKNHPEISASVSPNVYVLTRIVGWFERLREKVLERADHRFLYVSFLVERLTDADDLLSADTLSILNKGDEILDDFDVYLQMRLPRKLYDLSRRLVLVLAATEDADAWERQEVPPGYMAPEFRGIAFDELLELLGLPPGEGDAAGSLLFVLFALKSILSTWKGDEAAWTRYRLGLKGLAAVARNRWSSELDAVHRSIVSRFLEQSSESSRFLAAPDEPGSLMWRLPGHAEIAGAVDLTEQLAEHEWHVQALRVADDLMRRHRLRRYVHAMSLVAATFRRRKMEAACVGLASAYTNRAVARHLLGDLAGAIADAGLAAEGASAAMAEQDINSNMAANALSAALSARANARRDAGELAGCLEDYTRSLEVRQALLSAKPGPEQLEVYRGLASTWVNRGTALFDAGEFKLANEDLDHALHAMQALAEIGGPQSWLTPRDELAYAYACRSNARYKTGRMMEALADVDMALELLEARDGAELAQKSIQSINGLASAYISRSRIRQDLHDIQGALEDAEKAVSLREGLRAKLDSEYTSELITDLASAYDARGQLRKAKGELMAARTDYDAAVRLMDELLERLRPNLPPAVVRRMVALLNNGAEVSNDIESASIAIRDYGRAIELLEWLQARLRKDTPPEMTAEVVAALNNRGLVWQRLGEFEKAKADFCRAITVGDRLVKRVDEHALPDWIDNLAVAHLRLGLSLQQQNDLAGAIKNYGTAIRIMEDLHERPEVDWRPSYATDLASMYNNRGVALFSSREFLSAIRDLDEAIKLREQLRPHAASLRDLEHDLAGSYINRARARLDSSDWKAAVSDSDHALRLLQDLRDAREAEWPLSWNKDLAYGHMVRAGAYRVGLDLGKSFSDAETAIRLWEDLKAGAEGLWEESWNIELAISYFGRAFVSSSRGDEVEAQADYDQAINLAEGLRSRVANRWLPLWSSNLSNFYLNRGGLIEGMGDLRGAVRDATHAIDLAMQLRRQLGIRHPELWGYQMVGGYNNRANAHEKLGDLVAASRDRKRIEELGDELRAASL
jgi:tetratricopeptide (TPR) repeat protein